MIDDGNNFEILGFKYELLGTPQEIKLPHGTEKLLKNESLFALGFAAGQCSGFKMASEQIPRILEEFSQRNSKDQETRIVTVQSSEPDQSL